MNAAQTGTFGGGPGAFGVTRDGGAGYSIPLRVPPGTAGVQPQLSIAYNSGLGNGLLGVGFAVTGLSAITRVGATPAQDGFHSAVSYTGSDRLALDGVRLMPVEGTGYFDDAIYHTELESWQKVVPSYKGAVAGQHGPVFFNVHTRDGKVLQFGDDPAGTKVNASIPASATNPSIRVWALASMTDRNGNTVTFSYDPDPDNNNGYPLQIAYTSNRNLEASRFVQFNYAAPGQTDPVVRDDPYTLYIGGFPATTNRLLQSIQTLVGKNPVATWSFSYQYGQQTGRAQLVSVTETGSDNLSLPPTTLTWQDGPAGLEAPVPLKTTGPAGVQTIPMDVNGDGLTDIVIAGQDGSSLALSFLQSTVAGGTVALLPPVNLLRHQSVGFGPVIPMDVNGDGAMDAVVAVQDGSDTMTFTVLLATQDENGWFMQKQANAVSVPIGLLAPMDVNGDGLADLVCAFNEAGTVVLQTLFSDGTGFTRGELLTTTVPYFSGAQLIPLDFNGDGLTDLLYAWEDGTTLNAALFLSTGKTFTQVTNDLGLSLVYGAPLIAVDLNGDGRDDLVQVSNASGLNLQAWFSNGGPAGTAQFVAATPLPTGIDAGAGIPQLLPMDVNGDGLPDLAVGIPSGSDMSFYVLVNDGTAFKVLDGPPTQASQVGINPTILPMDINGDGKTELVTVITSGSDAYFSVLFTESPWPDLVDTVVNPLGGRIGIAYLPLTSSAVYDPTPPAPGITVCSGIAACGNQTAAVIPTLGLFGGRISGAAYSLAFGPTLIAGSTRATRVVDFPKYAVSQTTKIPRPNPAGKNEQVYTWGYTYRHALLDLTGRGWLGFAQMIVTDPGAATTTTTTYNQPFPCTGNPAAIAITSLTKEQPGALLKVMCFTYTTSFDTPVAGMTVWQVLPYQVLTNLYTFADPVNGVPDATLLRTQTYGDYGNLATLSETGSACGAPLYVWFEYQDRLKAWLLGFLTKQTVTADAEGNEILAQRAFTYGPRMNLASVSDLVAPDEFVTVGYRYDAYGNCIRKIDAAGAETRFAFDKATATFPVRVTSPPNAAGKKLVAQATFDPGFGVCTESLDWNGVRRTQVLDGLGRVQAAVVPNPRGKGTVTASSMAWLQDGFGVYRQTDVLVEWDGKTTAWIRHYVDGFGRVDRAARLGPDPKATTLVESTYNSSGAVIEQTFPHYADTPPDAIARLFTNYDAYMRPVHVRRVSSTGTLITAMAYPSSNELVRIDAVGTAQERRTAFWMLAYAGKRQVITRKDNLGHVSRFEYDPLGRLRILTDPLGVKKSVAYDLLGRLTKSSSSQDTTTFYDETTRYHTKARTIVRTDAMNNVVTSAYDQLGRLIKLTTLAGTAGAEPQVTRFKWDGSAQSANGRPAGATLYDGTTYTYAYDRMGSRKSVTVTLETDTYNVARAYTPLCDAEAITFPDGTVQRFQHNEAGALTEITYGKKRPFLASVHYEDFNPYGSAETVQYGNDVVETWAFDDLNRPGSLTVTDQQASLAGFTYQYYPNDAVESITDTVGAGSESYQYDGAGRLYQATGPYGTLGFQYDAGGNLHVKDEITYTSVGHQVQTGTDSGDTLVFKGGYDLNGNMTSAERGADLAQTQYTFDALDRLVGVTPPATGDTTMAYDHVGRRISKTSPAQGTLQFVAPEFCVYADPAATVARLRGAAGTIATYTAGSATNPNAPPPGVVYLHKNHLGSTILRTDGSGTPDTLSYAPFGEQQQSSPSSVVPTFTGKQFDSDTQLYAMGGRYYDPGLGRFISHDVMAGANLLRSDAFNGYAYAANDPTNLIDATGWSVGGGGGGGLGFAGMGRAGGSAFGIMPFNSLSVSQWFHYHGQEVETYAADGAMIIAGIALTVATAGLGSAIGAALIGAGLSGLVTNIGADVSNTQASWRTWGISVGTGAASGFVSAGVGSAIDAVAARIAEQAAVSASAAAPAAEATAFESASTVASNPVSNVLSGALKEAVGNSLGSGVGTIIQNWATRHNGLDGLGLSMGNAFVLGFLTGGVTTGLGGMYEEDARAAVLAKSEWGVARDDLENAKSLDDMAEVVEKRSKSVRIDPFGAADSGRVSEDVAGMIGRYRRNLTAINLIPGLFIEYCPTNGNALW